MYIRHIFILTFSRLKALSFGAISYYVATPVSTKVRRSFVVRVTFANPNDIIVGVFAAGRELLRIYTTVPETRGIRAEKRTRKLIIASSFTRI